jgi:hypothetical protein
MSRRASDSDGALPLDVLERIDRVCDRFEAAWQQGPRPRLEDYLGGFAEEHLPALIWHLLLADIEHRRARGETPVAAEYEDRFPNLAARIRDEFSAPLPAPRTPPAPAGNAEPRITDRLPIEALEGTPPMPPRYALKRLLGKGGIAEV